MVMQVASILSDLTSLRVCDPNAAQNLVSAVASKSAPGAQKNYDGSDPDLQRAKDLVDLHNNVKVRLEERGLDQELERLRRRVELMLDAWDRR